MANHYLFRGCYHQRSGQQLHTSGADVLQQLRRGDLFDRQCDYQCPGGQLPRGNRQHVDDHDLFNGECAHQLPGRFVYAGCCQLG